MFLVPEPQLRAATGRETFSTAVTILSQAKSLMACVGITRYPAECSVRFLRLDPSTIYHSPVRNTAAVGSYAFDRKNRRAPLLFIAGTQDSSEDTR